jgi:ecotin
MLRAMTRFLCTLVATVSVAAAADNMKAFPPAEAGQTRHVLQLPQQANEADLRVELVIGKTVKTDAVNRYFFGGKLEAVNIEGWGFTRYVLKNLGPMAGTMMAPPDAPRVDRFITIGSEPNLLRYNSRLPLVIYVPEGVEVRHRIWRADAETKPVPEG